LNQTKKRISGESWVDWKGNNRAAKTTALTHPPTCILKCFETIPLERRTKYFKEFYALPLPAQHTYILGLKRQITIPKQQISKKRQKKKGKKKRKERLRFKWYLGEDQVCVKAIYGIFQISQGFIVDVAEVGGRSNHEDMRKNSRFKKESTRKAINKHIQSFPTEPSHYHRKNIPHKRFIVHPEIKNVSDMYRKFVEFHSKEKDLIDDVCVQYYRMIFQRDYNIGFKIPVSDTCNVCDSHRTKKQKKSRRFIRHQAFQSYARKDFVADTKNAVSNEQKKQE